MSGASWNRGVSGEFRKGAYMLVICKICQWKNKGSKQAERVKNGF